MIVQLQETTTIPAWCEMILLGTTQGTCGLAESLWLLEGRTTLIDKTGLQIAWELVTLSESKPVPVRILNLAGDSVKFYKGTTLADLSAIDWACIRKRER